MFSGSLELLKLDKKMRLKLFNDNNKVTEFDWNEKIRRIR